MDQQSITTTDTTTPTTKRPLPASKFDLTTWSGRFWHFLHVTDCRNLLATAEQRERAFQVLRDYQDGKPVPDHIFWPAKQLIDSSTRSGTNDVIFAPFRLAAFAPMNIVIAYGLLLPNVGTATTITWQVINQLYNVAINHSNRNPSNPMTNQQLLEAIGAASLSSAGVSVALGQFVKRAHSIAPRAASLIRMFVPFFAVATAGALNVFLMRRNETQEGVEVRTPDGELVGSSPKAGTIAVTLTAISRVVTSLPILVVPPIVMGTISARTRLFSRFPRLRLPIELGVISCCLVFGLPAAVALFPEDLKVSPKTLEERFHNIQTPDGKNLEFLQFKKGL